MRFLIPLILVVGVTGCDKAISNYVSGAKPVPEGTNRAPDAVPETPPGQALRYSAGSVDAASGNLRMKAGINGQHREFTMGADRRAVLSIGRSRVVQTP